MGLVFREVEFDYPAPDADTIIAKIQALSGLDIKAKSLLDSDDIRSINMNISFACIPNNVVQLTVYDKDKVSREKQQDAFEMQEYFTDIDTDRLTDAERQLLEFGTHQNTQGFDEADDKQLVYLQCGMEKEPTLMFTIERALEALGGKSTCPKWDTVVSFPLDEHVLKQSNRKNTKEVSRLMLVVVLLHIVLLPYFLLKSLFSLLLFPFKTRKIVKQIKADYPNFTKK